MFEFLIPVILFGVIFGTAFIITVFILPGLLQVIRGAGFVKPNYRGDTVPLGAGLVFFLACLPVGIALLAILPRVATYCQAVTLTDQASEFHQKAAVLARQTISLFGRLPLFLLGIAAMTLVGIIDDIFGNRSATGLRGHFAKLFREGQITTGTIKAAIGGMLGLGIAVAGSPEGSLGSSPGGSPAVIILQALTIALSINAVNLLDLRPGRAGKGFVLAALILVAVSQPWLLHLEIVFLAMVLGSLTAYLPRDLQAGAMMGDAGANALGITLGVVGSWILPLWGLIVYLIVLVGFHIFTERYSLTEYIEKVPVLRFLDNLGRQ